MKRTFRRLLTVAAIAGSALAFNPAAALAYSGGGAANYANTYATSPNSAFYDFNDDCTNFVSQALWKGGGFAFVGTPNQTVLNDDSQWWTNRLSGQAYGSSHTYSFTVASDLFSFLVGHTSKTSAYVRQSAGSQGSYTPSQIVAGDPVWFDWDNNGSINHVAIQVGTGTDPSSGWYGNLVDEHTSNRQSAFWTLKPYNSQWATTVTTEAHIYA